MSDKEVGAKKRDSVVAIARAEGRLQAVEVRGKSSRFEILWTQTGKDEQSDWGRFAADCGLPAPWGATGPVEQSDGDGRKEVVAGFSSAGVVFNRIEVPAAARADVESIVRFQAESRLPLSAEQMELVWRPGHATNGQLPVTMAAARTDRLRAFVNEVKSILPAKIMLDAEGIVKVWRSFFGGDDGVAVVVSAGATSSQLCLAEDGALVNAVVLDMGVNDFAVGRVQTEATERFVRDVRSILEMFGYSDPDELRIMVLSDGSDTFEAIAGALVSAGLNAGAVGPDVSQIAQGGNLSDETVYDYRLPIGLGLIALEARGDELNIFKRLYSPLEKAEKKSGLYSLIGAGALAVAMLVVLLVVSYAVDAAKPGAIDRAIEKVFAEKGRSEIGMKGLAARQGLRKEIAAQRPDMLHLIKLLDDIAAGRIEGREADNDAGRGGTRLQESGNDSGRGRGGSRGGNRNAPNSGIKLEEVNFKKGSLASVSGEAPGEDQVHKFEKDLNASDYISSALILPNLKQDEKTKKYSFTIEFKYRKFSEKKTLR
jgi:hypothetical protein